LYGMPTTKATGFHCATSASSASQSGSPLLARMTGCAEAVPVMVCPTATPNLRVP